MSDQPLGGGGDRSWLTPLTPEGNRQTDSPVGGDITGCHTGFCFGLNVRGAKENYSYQWLNRKPNEVAVARMKGFVLVRDGDSDSPAYMAGMEDLQDESDTPTSLDTSQVFQDVVLARIPTERLRALKDDEGEKAKRALRGGAAAFVAGATPEELATDPSGRPTRFVPRQGQYGSHSISFKEDNETSDTWVPERGIVERG